ncbi:cupin [Pelagibacterales bacterium SAG-MED21]|nr:cupin [Pelagibacterales bacterium SAG-MED21]
MKKIKKPWGSEEIIELNKKFCVKKIFMKKNHRCSLQYHKKKIETITTLKGILHVQINKKNIILKPFESISIKPLTKHRMFAKKSNCTYLESSTTELKDIVRIEDDYKRI